VRELFEGTGVELRPTVQARSLVSAGGRCPALRDDLVRMFGRRTASIW
jgi:hypothetical protein